MGINPFKRATKLLADFPDLALSALAPSYTHVSAFSLCTLKSDFGGGSANRARCPPPVSLPRAQRIILIQFLDHDICPLIMHH
jgi:hypothetical protein